MTKRVTDMKNDDSDMKIVGDVPDAAEIEAAETADTALLLEREKENGNLSRARRLGAILAEEVSASEGEHPSGEIGAAEVTQRRILLAFIAETGIESLLPNSMLIETAQSVFYSTLRVTAPTFFEDLQGSGAFSFYRLHIADLRMDWDSAVLFPQIGETYAALCGQPESVRLTAEGAKIYAAFVERVRFFTGEMKFEA